MDWKHTITKASFIQAVLSAPFNKTLPKKIDIRPILIKGQSKYQISRHIANQVLHTNIDDPLRYLEEQAPHYGQTLIFTEEADYQLLYNNKGRHTLLKKKPTKRLQIHQHNRPKQTLLEGPVPFLIALGIMTSEGNIIAKKYDKFRQINRFVELVKDVLPAFETGQTLRIIDFGSGKAYLTFALHHYLHNQLGWPVDILGLDLKADVVQTCEALARQLHCEGLRFQIGDIQHYHETRKVDMVVTLHACDTATDHALAKAVSWGADVILSVPCCQHEAYNQIRNPDLEPLLKHGILKERFAALATDAGRAQLLEVLGYQTQVLEFIDLEHTPKNILIRAIKKKNTKPNAAALQAYQRFAKALGLQLTFAAYID